MTWLSLLGWLAGSRAGRVAAVVVLTLLMVAIAAAAAFRRGATLERAAQAAATLDHIRKRIASDDEIASLPAAERRDRLMRWATDR
jgi:hypothetical protein